MRKRARERQGISCEESEDSSRQLTQSSTETRYEVVIKNGAVVSIPVTEERNTVQFTASGHVNFFANLEEGQKVEGVANKEHEAEKKKEQEDYEKQIGLLTYLGQGSRESTGESAWYEKPSLLKSLQQQPPEVVNHKAEKAKEMFDPLRVIHHYIGKPEPMAKKGSGSSKVSTSALPSPAPVKAVELKSANKKHKRKSKKEKKKKSKKSHKRRHSSTSDSEDSDRHKKTKKAYKESSESSSGSSSSDSSEDEKEAAKKKQLEILRAKRLQREKEERARTNKLLANVHGLPPPREKPDDEEEADIKVKPKVQKYHSQYNPDIAKQNQPLDSNTKYWLQ